MQCELYFNLVFVTPREVLLCVCMCVHVRDWSQSLSDADTPTHRAERGQAERRHS